MYSSSIRVFSFSFLFYFFYLFFFFFNDTATTEIYTLSLHDALPIFLLEPVEAAAVRAARDAGDRPRRRPRARPRRDQRGRARGRRAAGVGDRKSTRLNSSHGYISYAVFCLKKKT